MGDGATAWNSLAYFTGSVSDGDKGDITVSGSGSTWTIDNGVVTLAKQANMATASVVYRKTAGAGAPEVQTLATLKTDLGLSGTNSGDQTSIVGITGSLAEFNAALTGADFATGGGTATGANTGDQTITLTGDVTGTGTGSFATTIANNAVTNAKLATMATASFKGRTTAGVGNVEDLSATQATALLNTFTSSDKGLAPASGGGTANFLRADGSWAAPGGSALTYWTEAQNSSAPNGTVYANSLTATSGAGDADAVIKPKGTGAFQLAVADNTSAGGNKRGQYAIDLQTARTSADQVASGDKSFVSGYGNKASGLYSAAIGGFNEATGAGSVALGDSCVASADNAIVIGNSATSDGVGSVALMRGHTRGVSGAIKWGSPADTRYHFGEYTLYAVTSDATPTVAKSNGSAASATNQVCLPVNPTTMTFSVLISAQEFGGTPSAGYKLEGVIRRTSAGTTAIVGTVAKTILAEVTSSWDVSATADTTNDCLKITVTGQAATTIVWAVRVSTSELIG